MNFQKIESTSGFLSNKRYTPFAASMSMNEVNDSSGNDAG